MTARLPIDGTPALSEYKLTDNLTATRGRIFLTGTQALVRILLAQRELDRARGWNTAGFVSGYRGSPLGMVDQQMWKAKKLLDAADVRFLPAINEELGGTAVLGTQRVEADPERTVEGVFAMWYGKGPGVDRAGDALKHGNAYGSSPHGGVLVVAGDDHGCVSSSMPHQSDFSMMAWHMPIVNPSHIADMLEFGAYGYALSRFSGAWVGFKAISETVESGATVDLDALTMHWSAPADYAPPPGGLHNRWPDLPSLTIEARLDAKLDAVRAFARTNSIDKWIATSPRADVGIATCGKAHLDLMEALRRLDLTVADLDAAGVRIYKVGLSFPLETTRLDTFVDGLKEVLVIEEKGPVIEQQIKDHLYNRSAQRRPAVIGKHDAQGLPLLSSLGELRPSRVLPVFAEWLAHHKPALDRRERVVDLVAPRILSNAADAVRRTPYFCSGCPHNTSTKVPEGSIAQAGIGCHFMASWMDRDTTGLIQMGGEGVDWASHSMFTKTRHVFQNLGDGTYFHSGILAIRQAVAAKTNITYKILYNDAVRPAGRRQHLGAADRASSRSRRRVALRRRIGRTGKVRRSSWLVPERHDVPPSARARCRAARVARNGRRHGPHLRSDLRRRETPPPQEGRVPRSRQAPLHQRGSLRRLRRLRRAIELLVGRARRDAARAQAPHRSVVVQQGLFLRERLLPELRHDRRRQAQESGRRGIR
jgi:indolepyruvate ferredoxin oxidoreductase